jgi:ABC-type xylose transport system permease subunit
MYSVELISAVLLIALHVTLVGLLVWRGIAWLWKRQAQSKEHTHDDS